MTVVDLSSVRGGWTAGDQKKALCVNAAVRLLSVLQKQDRLVPMNSDSNNNTAQYCSVLLQSLLIGAVEQCAGGSGVGRQETQNTALSVRVGVRLFSVLPTQDSLVQLNTKI